MSVPVECLSEGRTEEDWELRTNLRGQYAKQSIIEKVAEELSVVVVSTLSSPVEQTSDPPGEQL